MDRLSAADAPLAGPSGATLFITHAEGGGVLRHVEGRIRALLRAGGAAWVLMPASFGGDAVLRRPGLPDRRFVLPGDRDALLAELRAGVATAEVHHLRSHHPVLKRLPLELGVPFRAVVHDWSPICPRATLCGPDGRFCGEPAPPACERCVRGYERLAVAAPGGVAALREDWSALLRAAREVLVASEDAARRVRRHFPGLSPRIVPWEEPAPPGLREAQAGFAAPRRAVVGVVGRLSRAKGFGVLLDCAADAAARRLAFSFLLAGRSEDDAALRATGRCAVSGEFAEGEGPAILRRGGAAIGFLPSVWPETWCYALSALRDAGLGLVCFDIGAQAARVREAGGLVLPLGLPPARVNDLLSRRLAVLDAAPSVETTLVHG